MTENLDTAKACFQQNVEFASGRGALGESTVVHAEQHNLNQGLLYLTLAVEDLTRLVVALASER